MENRCVAINQFDGNVKLLKIELETGNRVVISKDEIEDDCLSFGIFEVEKDGPDLESVALLATPAGPLLLLKEIQYHPEVGKTRIEIRDDEDFSHFRIFHGKIPIFGLFYRKKFGIGLHPYNNEREDIDFYYWLSKNIDNPKLYQIYTKPIRYIDCIK